MKTLFPIKQLKSLDLSFDEHGSVYSNNYSDIYFQPGIGLDEKKHVFLKGNDLPANWKNKEKFCIAETDFGTGLNFLNTLKLWHESSQNNQHLDYISCELHPFNSSQLKQALSYFPELQKYCDALINKYPKYLMSGIHRINFSSYNVSLTLVFGDCIAAFENIDCHVDAWFFDGFGPSKNPEMWSERLFRAISKLSHIGTTAATFTVARAIRDGLSDVGFEIKKTPGFGQKREMLTARFKHSNSNEEKQPWAQTFKSSSTDSFTIIGAGIAGLTLADKLQQSGKSVTIIDRQIKPCLETSGNPQAMVMPSFDLNDSPEARFYLSAFLYAIRYYSDEYFHADGVLDLALTEKQKHWQDTFLNRFDLPNSLVKQNEKGLLYASSGWLDTQAHAKSISQKLKNYIQSEIVSIEFHNKQWHLKSSDGTEYKTECLILANGINAKKLLPDYDLPTTAKHGEISFFNSGDFDSNLTNNPHVLLNKGYIMPEWNGQQSLGATFDPMKYDDYFNPAQTNSDHWQRNKALWKKTEFEKLLNTITSEQSRAGIRVTTPDHLPICGPVINQTQFKKDYHDIKHGKKWKTYPLPEHRNNLYIFTGLGSRGYTSAPLLAEFLSNQILGNTASLDKNMQKTIHPNRFLIKSLQRN